MQAGNQSAQLCLPGCGASYSLYFDGHIPNREKCATDFIENMRLVFDNFLP